MYDIFHDLPQQLVLTQEKNSLNIQFVFTFVYKRMQWSTLISSKILIIIKRNFLSKIK